MKKLAVLVLAALAIAAAGAPGVAYAQKPTLAAPCTQCHTAAADVVRGSKVSHSEQFKTLQVAVGKLVWVITYDENTRVEGAKSIADIPKEKEIAVKFTGDEKKPYAASVAVKPPATLPAEKLVSTAEMVRLASMGPEKGGYVLIDSRPTPRFIEGHLPGAVSMPMAAFEKMKDKVLPAEKGKLVIFYCAGVT
jgi:hypothetical protein